MALDYVLTLLPALAFVVYLIARNAAPQPETHPATELATAEPRLEPTREMRPLDHICADFADSGELNVARALQPHEAAQAATQDLAQLAQSLEAAGPASPVEAESTLRLRVERLERELAEAREQLSTFERIAQR